MKKTTPLTLVLLFIFALSAQAQQAKSHDLKGSGEVFYTTTFDWENPDDPKGWAAPEGFYMEDPGDIGYNWHWMASDSMISQWVQEPPFQSSSMDDGCLALYLDMYNNYLDPTIAVNNAVVFPTFDCSTKSSVVVRYETSFMCYSGGWEMSMLVSRDAGVHWATFDVGFGCGHKDRPNDVAAGQAAIYEANISEVAAGASEVIIKFLWAGTDDYFWLIDDFQLAEAFDNDLRMKHYVLEWDDGDESTNESFIHNIPISQVGGAFTNFQASVFNSGEFDQYGVYLDLDIVKNSQSIWNQKSEADYLPTLLLDTVSIEEPFSPTEFGHYKITYDFIQEEEEQTPDNDKAEVYFNVTDSIYSRCDDTSEESYVWGFEAYGDEGVPNEQHFVGGIFPIYGECEVNSVSVYVTGGMADGMIEFRSAIYWVPPPEEEDQTPIELLLSEIIPLDSSMHNTWVTLSFEKDGESEFLLPGDKVYAGIEYWNWHTEVRPYKRYENFKIGSDVGVKLKDPVSVCRRGVEADFDSGTTVAKRKLMVRLNINDNSNITDGVDLGTAMSRLEQNYPNPVNGSTEITYELANSSGVIIEVTDMTGRTVLQFNEGNKPAGKHSMQISTTSLEAGVYFYTLKAGNFIDTKRMIVSD